jgi:flagellar protein FlbD
LLAISRRAGRALRRNYLRRPRIHIAPEVADKFPGMIHLTRINHRPLVVNAELIEHVESAPDTVVSMTTGEKFVVAESADEIVARVIGYRRAILESK